MAFVYLSKYLKRDSLDGLASAELQAALKTVLAQPAAYEPWQAVLELLAAWPDGPERRAALAQAQRALAAWPDDLRALSSRWAPLFEATGAAAVLGLAGVVQFHRHEDGATAALCKLAESPHARHLHALEFDRCEIFTAGWKALASSSNLSGLQRLKIHNCSIAGGERALLLSAPLLRQLTSLQLTSLDLADADVARLAQGGSFSKLRQLDLSRNTLGAPGVRQLLTARILGAGARLTVRKSQISDADFAALEREAAAAGVALER